MIPMTNELKKRIQIHVKNGLDISDLVKGVNIKGENLSRAILSDFNRNKENLSGTDFSYATIGKEGKVTNLCNNKFLNCNFNMTKFLGIVFIRRCDCRGSNFNGAHLHNVEYQYTKLQGCTFCGAILRIGTDYGFGAKFDESLFRDLTKGWNLEIKVKKESKDE